MTPGPSGILTGQRALYSSRDTSAKGPIPLWPVFITRSNTSKICGTITKVDEDCCKQRKTRQVRQVWMCLQLRQKSTKQENNKNTFHNYSPLLTHNCIQPDPNMNSRPKDSISCVKSKILDSNWTFLITATCQKSTICGREEWLRKKSSGLFWAARLALKSTSTAVPGTNNQRSTL